MGWMATAPSRDWIALTLAIGLCTALNLFCVAVLLDAAFGAEPGLSENATQILTGWGGGIVGILGAVFGYKAGTDAAVATTTAVTAAHVANPAPINGQAEHDETTPDSAEGAPPPRA